MIGHIRRFAAKQKKRRVLDRIRREFDKHGHKLDGVPDERLEAVLASVESQMNAASLSAKPIYLAIRRLASGEKHRPGRQSPLMNEG